MFLINLAKNIPKNSLKYLILSQFEIKRDSPQLQHEFWFCGRNRQQKQIVAAKKINNWAYVEFSLFIILLFHDYEIQTIY